MINTKAQWEQWVTAIVADLATCDIKKSKQEVAGELAKIIGFDIDSSEMNVDLSNALLCEENLESKFHAYVNVDSVIDDFNPLAPIKQFYPPCRQIFPLLPTGIVLSEQEADWYWSSLLLNAFGRIEPDPINLDWIDLYKKIRLVTTGDGKMIVSNLEQDTVEAINDTYLNLTNSRFFPLIQEKHCK